MIAQNEAVTDECKQEGTMGKGVAHSFNCSILCRNYWYKSGDHVKDSGGHEAEGKFQTS
jgi:hypothetical protein